MSAGESIAAVQRAIDERREKAERAIAEAKRKAEEIEAAAAANDPEDFFRSFCSRSRQRRFSKLHGRSRADGSRLATALNPVFFNAIFDFVIFVAHFPF